MSKFVDTSENKNLLIAFTRLLDLEQKINHSLHNNKIISINSYADGTAPTDVSVLERMQYAEEILNKSGKNKIYAFIAHNDLLFFFAKDNLELISKFSSIKDIMHKDFAKSLFGDISFDLEKSDLKLQEKCEVCHGLPCDCD